MTFFAPAFLALSLLAGIVVMLHMQKSRSLNVGSLMLWRRVAATQTSASRRWQRLPLSLLLFLQIGVVLALALALAHPVLNGRYHVEHAIYILDGSSYMQAEGPEGTRFSEAVERVAAMTKADAAAATGRFTIIFAGVVPNIILARQRFDPAFQEELKGLEPDDGGADWAGVTRLVDAVVRSGETTRIVLVTIGAVPPELLNRDIPLHLEQLAPGVDRIDHVMEARLVPAEPSEGRWTLTGTITTNSDDAGAGMQLVVRFMPEGSQSLVDWARVRATASRSRAPGSGGAPVRSLEFSHDLTLPGPGVLIAQIDGGDAEPYNDMVRLTVPPRKPVFDVLYVGRDIDPALRRAIETIDGAVVHPAADVPADSARYALAIIDEVAVSHAPATNTIWVGTARPASAEAPAVMVEPDPVAWRTDHTLGESMDWSALRLSRAYAVPLHEDAVVLLQAAEGPLVQAWTDANGRQLQIAFELNRSNWTERTSFPVFISRFVRWSGLQPDDETARACVVGRPCRVDARLVNGEVRRLDGDMPASLPDDIAAQVMFSRDGRFVPTRAGLYLLSTPAAQQLVAVNPDTSVSRPANWVDENPDVARSIALWWIAALVALIILVVEAILAFRRSARSQRTAVALRAVTILLVMVAILVPSVRLPRLQELVVAIDTRGAAWPDGGKVLMGQDLALVQGGDPVQVVRDFGEGGSSAPSRTAAAGRKDALFLASAMLPQGHGRIVIGDDGLTEPGDLAAAIGHLRHRGIHVDRVPFTASGEDTLPVRVERVELPALVYEGDDVVVTAVVTSVADLEADISFYRDGELLTRQPVTLKRGYNRVESVIEAVGPGTALYEIDVATAAGPDSVEARNGAALTPLPAGPVAILVENAGEGEAFADALAQQGIESRILTPSRYPAYLREWLRYRAAILLDVPARAFTTAQQELLETAVRDYGLGVLLIGGDSSFGPGGYLETALDRLSPLSSDIPGEMPETALVFVLDRSGSMQQPVESSTRLDIAKQATRSAIQRLNPRSSIAIVVFDDKAQTVVPLQRVEEAQDLDQRLASFGPGGGTAIYPALEEAFAQLRESDAMVKHVVVMTDGLSQPADFTSLVNKMRAAGITVSTVAIGTGAAIPIVDHFARLGGGNFHTTTDFASLPSILAQEATMFSAAPVEEGQTEPFWTAPRATYLNLLPEDLPPIEGFVLTSPKPAAQVVLMTPDNEGEPMPLLAHWRYGNGKVIALTTDAVGPWTRRWQNIETYSSFWVEAVRHHLSENQGPGTVLQTERHGDEIEIRLVATDEDGRPASGLLPRARIHDGSAERTVVLVEDMPGTYRGRFVADHPGTFRIEAEAGTERSETAVHVAFPAHAQAGPSSPGIRVLSRETGGTTLSPGAAIFRTSAWHRVNTVVWPALLTLASLIFILELMIRYAWRPWQRLPRLARIRP